MENIHRRLDQRHTTILIRFVHLHRRKSEPLLQRLCIARFLNLDDKNPQGVPMLDLTNPSVL